MSYDAEAYARWVDGLPSSEPMLAAAYDRGYKDAVAVLKAEGYRIVKLEAVGASSDGPFDVKAELL